MNQKQIPFLRESNTWTGVNRKITNKALRDAMPALEYVQTIPNEPYKLQPKDLVDYPFRSLFRDKGMGSYFVYHFKQNVFEELKIDPIPLIES